MIDPTVTVVVGLGLAGRAVARAVTQRGMRAMALEDQRPDAEAIRQRVDEAARHYVDKRGLWS